MFLERDRMQPAFMYDLGFVSRNRSLSRKSEIVFTLPSWYVPKLLERLAELAERSAVEAQEYLKEKRPLYRDGAKNYFGYHACCRIEEGAPNAHLYFELTRRHVPAIALTLTFLTGVLPGLSSESVALQGEWEQLFRLTTYCNPTLHGHGIGGWVFPVFGKWLTALGQSSDREALGQVSEAMAEMWHQAAPPEHRRYMDECLAAVHEDGRFTLQCFGDACDLSIYPEQVCGSLSEYVTPFSSHNVEAAHQQLTLVAGLAALVQRARADLQKGE